MKVISIIIAVVVSVAFAPLAFADGQKRTSGSVIQLAQKSQALSLRQAYRKGLIVKKRRYPRSLISKARRSGDEIDECMKNPDNQHIPYIERLGACFCLAIDNKLKGCQTAD